MAVLLAGPPSWCTPDSPQAHQFYGEGSLVRFGTSSCPASGAKNGLEKIGAAIEKKKRRLQMMFPAINLHLWLSIAKFDYQRGIPSPFIFSYSPTSKWYLFFYPVHPAWLQRGVLNKNGDTEYFWRYHVGTWQHFALGNLGGRLKKRWYNDNRK